MYGRSKVNRRRAVRKAAPTRRYGKSQVRGKSLRKNRRKVFASGAPSQVVIRQPSGLADRCLLKLKYEGYIDTAQASGALTDHIFSGNSIFVCDHTAATGSVYLLPEWAAFYNSYTCLGSSIRVNQYTNATDVFTSEQFVVPSLIPAAFGNEAEMIEQPYSRKQSQLVTSQGGAGLTPQKHYMSTAKLFGKNKRAIMDDNQFSVVGSSSGLNGSPTLQWFWHVGNWTPGGATQSYIASVSLTYYVVLWDRQVPES